VSVFVLLVAAACQGGGSDSGSGPFFGDDVRVTWSDGTELSHVVDHLSVSLFPAGAGQPRDEAEIAVIVEDEASGPPANGVQLIARVPAEWILMSQWVATVGDYVLDPTLEAPVSVYTTVDSVQIVAESGTVEFERDGLQLSGNATIVPDTRSFSFSGRMQLICYGAPMTELKEDGGVRAVSWDQDTGLETAFCQPFRAVR
jgi:hypothetical protein